MTFIVDTVCVLSLVALALGTGWLFGRQRARLLTEHLRDRFMVTTKTGDTFDGLLGDVDVQTLVLDDVRVFQKNGQWAPADGRVFLARSNVAYMQRTTRQIAESQPAEEPS